MILPGSEDTSDYMDSHRVSERASDPKEGKDGVFDSQYDQKI